MGSNDVSQDKPIMVKAKTGCQAPLNKGRLWQVWPTENRQGLLCLEYEAWYLKGGCMKLYQQTI